MNILGMSHCPMGLWDGDGIDSGTYMHLQEGQVDILWNVPWSHGIVGWDGQWDTQASVRRTGGYPMGLWDGMDSGTHTYISERDTVDIPWNVP